MSNHAGGHLLNEVFGYLIEQPFFAGLPTRERLRHVRAILKIAERRGCGSGDILDEVGVKMGICWGCFKFATKFKWGYCPKCFAENAAADPSVAEEYEQLKEFEE